MDASASCGKLLLPNLPQPRYRLPQGISETVNFVMRGVGERNEPCVHVGFLELRNACRRWGIRCDLIVKGMNGQDRKPPSGGGCRRRAGDRNRSAETPREFLRKMPGARAAHAVTGDGNLVLLD